MANFWEQDQQVSEGNSAPQPIISLPDSGKADDRGFRNEGREISQDYREFDEITKLRDAFSKLPEVVEYRTAVRAYAAALKTSPNSAGDQTLITSYAKMLDPNSVVREGEFNTVASGDSRANQIIAQIQKEGGFGEGGMLRPEYRQKMRREMQNMVSRYNDAYNLQRKDYSNFAQQNGYEPDQVLGTHPGAAFKQDIQDYWESVAPKEPETRGGVPVGTDITFDAEEGFSRERALAENFKVTPNQEALISAFMNKNRGNTSMTAKGIKDYYKSIGVEVEPQVTDEALAELHSGNVSYTGFDTSPFEAEYNARKEKLMAERDNLLGEVDANIRGIADTATLGLSDKLAAVGDTVVGGGTYAENLENQRMISQADEEVNPIGRISGQVIGGAVLPFGAGAKSASELAKVGGAAGAAYGFNSSDGDIGDKLLSATTGGVTGAVGGGALGAVAPVVGRGVNAVRGRLPKSSGSQQEFVDAASRQDLDYMIADVPGKTAAKYATGLSGVTLGGIPIRDAALKIVDKAGAARDRIAGNLSSVGDDAGTGQAVRRGVEAWEKKAGGKVDELYRAIPIKPDAKSQISQTQAALREINAGLKSNPELSEQIADPTMKRFQSALEEGELSWEDLKKFRSYVGEKAGRPTFQQDTSKDSLDRLYGALSADMEATALANGPNALNAFKRANTYYRAMQKRREDVMKKLVGGKLDASPEATFKQMQSWAKTKGGDYKKFSQALRSLPEDEANAVRASFIDRLGNDKAGMSSMDSENFSPAKFLTHWKDLSGRSKAVLFKGEHRQALDDLATVFEGMGDAGAFTNPSKTSIGSFAIGTAALTGSNPFLGALAAGGQYGTGKLLANPAFAKWLMKSRKKPNPSAQLAHVRKLSGLAKSNPAIAEDVLSLQAKLAEAFAATPQRAAAEDAQSSETTRTLPGPQ